MTRSSRAQYHTVYVECGSEITKELLRQSVNMMMEDGMFSVIAEETNAYAVLCQ